MTLKPNVQSFWDAATGSWQYVFHDPQTKEGAIVDPVLDFDPADGKTSTENADRILDYVRQAGLKIVWILDTHPHADHFSAAGYLGQKLGAPRAIGEKVAEIQSVWRDIYNLPDGFPEGTGYWDRVFADGDSFKVGDIPVDVLFTPGHTLATITYVAGDAAFVNDTFMMPANGSARADFPGGSSAELYDSLQRILSLPDATRLFIGHDYPAEGAEPACIATVAEHRARNTHLKDASREAFITLRDERDATLGLPDRMLAALQVNLRGGQLPEPEADGRSYLKIPLNAF
ncbi:SoxH protein [Rhodovulum sp. P5]|uniref:MBL fold metallo-hydrolase n=1 Tax=Rhodovulum sp. P5 TaxID=1564506 RepID=UPI0009C2F0A1|nr:MBL fold metallo-hydrolase [Rhodovulum sp. P5]ARE40572.1 SoxH protein [Rhodovulum sp. P5]